MKIQNKDPLFKSKMRTLQFLNQCNERYKVIQKRGDKDEVLLFTRKLTPKQIHDEKEQAIMDIFNSVRFVK